MAIYKTTPPYDGEDSAGALKCHRIQKLPTKLNWIPSSTFVISRRQKLPSRPKLVSFATNQREMN